MSAIPNNTVGQTNSFNYDQLKEAISQGSIVVNGQTKYFYELINDNNFIQNSDLYHAALYCINLSKESAGTDPKKYDQLVRGYTLLNNPQMSSLAKSTINQNAKTIYEQTLTDCETKFGQDLPKFISSRNTLINKPTTAIEEKISKENPKIFLRLNNLDFHRKSEELAVKDWSLVKQNIMRNKDTDVETAWQGIVGKVTDFLHFDRTNPKNLESVENSLLNGEYDDVYLRNALINGEAIIDGRKESFKQLLEDPKFVQNPRLYASTLQLIDNFKNKEKLSENEVGQLIRAYEILQTPTVTSLPERKFYQIFANQTYNNALASCENAFSKNFDVYLAQSKPYIGGNFWLDQFRGKDQTILTNLNTLSNPPIAQWNAVKADIIHGKLEEAQGKWMDLTSILMHSSNHFSMYHQVDKFLLNGEVPTIVQARIDQDEFQELNVKEDEGYEAWIKEQESKPIEGQVAEPKPEIASEGPVTDENKVQ